MQKEMRLLGYYYANIIFITKSAKTCGRLPPSKTPSVEADCFALLRITDMIGSDWLEWDQNYCTQIEKCKALCSIDIQKTL